VTGGVLVASASGELRGLAFQVVLAAGDASQVVAVRRGRSQVGQLADRAGERPQHRGVALAECGIVARRFQARYPADVTGMLLVDSSHEDQSRRFGWWTGAGSHLWYAARRQSRVLGVRRLAASLGRLSVVDRASLIRETVPEYAGAARAITLSSKQRRIVVREQVLAAQLRGRPQDLGALPLTVISSANRWWDRWPTWSGMQDELAALSSDSVRLTAVNAGHNVHIDEPLLVVQAIRDLVERCRARHATNC
jgi:pimeloyl-ACP methyl ester carboxylesterase